MKNLKMAQKLALLVTLLLVITVVVASVGIYQLSEFNSRMQQVVNVTAKALENAFKVRNRILQVIRHEKSSVLSTEDNESIRFAELPPSRLACQPSLVLQKLRSPPSGCAVFAVCKSSASTSYSIMPGLANWIAR